MGEETGTTDGENERAVGRIFGLTDAVFAIAMTLLALDLKVPDVGVHPVDSVLRHALSQQGSSYLAFLLSFYVISKYWRRHHRLMRTVRVSDPALLRWTILLLLATSSMPFAADLLGVYGGSAAIAVTIYSLVNAVAIAALLLIQHELIGRRLASDDQGSGNAHYLWCDLVAFLLSAVAGYLLAGHGLISMIVLVVLSGAVSRLISRRRVKRDEREHDDGVPADPASLRP
jgi:uncharacterized membrane protein